MSKPMWATQQEEILIEKYQEEKCLYAVSDPNYHMKNLRRDALDRIAAALQEVRPGTTGDECFKKIRNMRTAYEKIKKRIKESSGSGAGTSDVFKPRAWYFSKLSFLEEFHMPRQSKSSPIGHKKDTVVKEPSEEDRPARTVYELEHSIFDKIFEAEHEDPDEPFSPIQLDLESNSSSPQPEQSLPMLPHIESAPNPDPVQTPSTEAPKPKNPAPKPSASKVSTLILKPTAPVPTPTSSGTGQRKRKLDQDTKYINAVQSIADNMGKRTEVSTSTEDTWGKFIVSVLKSIKSEEVRVDLMASITSSIMEAKKRDLQ